MAYREKGATALAHGHRGRKPTNATSEAVIADVVHLARTRYDDATGTGVDALSCFSLTRGLLHRCGIPVALYTGRHGVFRHTPGTGLTGTSIQFSRAMDELGIKMIFALSPKAKGRVERTAGTFQGGLVTELRLSEAGSTREANSVLEQFLPRFSRRFRVLPQYLELAFRALDPELCLEQILCFKHRRKVGRDNTVRLQVHTFQLLPGPERPSYARVALEVLEALDGRLSVRHEGRIIAAQEAPTSPVFLRNGHGRFGSVLVPPSRANGLSERWAAAVEPLDSRTADEVHGAPDVDKVAETGRPAATPARKRRSFRRSDGRQFRKPDARGCRFGQSSGNWESTGAPSRNTWTLRVHLRDSSRRLLLPRRHLIPSRPDRVAFSLNT